MRRLTLNLYVYWGFLICISAQQLPIDQETQRITYKGVVEVGNLEAALNFVIRIGKIQIRVKRYHQYAFTFFVIFR